MLRRTARYVSKHPIFAGPGPSATPPEPEFSCEFQWLVPLPKRALPAGLKF
jgi:hypothetical protein